MSVRKRYKVFSDRDEGGPQVLLEVEDLRGVAEEGDGFIELTATFQGAEDQDDITVWLTTETAMELSSILSVMTGTANTEQMVLADGPDALS